MKQSIKAITDILTACGCKPAAAIDANGDAIIKVNAPALNACDPAELPNFNSPECFFCEPD